MAELRQSAEPAAQAAPIHPDSALGAVTLTVADLERVRAFYEQVIGLRTLDRSRDRARLGTATTLVELLGEPDAPPRPPHTTGLFHLALLVPDRRELARTLRRVVDAGGSFSGASDHLVSEALYLHDPEGNGIEIYRDRPRAEWRVVDGILQMATEPLDLEGVMSELDDGSVDEGMAAATRLGHIHLQVSDLAAAEAFYHGLLGFDVTVRGYRGALFMAAGGYHHHIGVNTWAGPGAPPPPPGARGLRSFEVVLPNDDEIARIAGRVEAAGLEGRRDEDGRLVVTDPFANSIVLRSAL